MNRISRARDVLPLPRLLQRIGLGLHATKSSDCPFCQARKKFGIYESKTHGGHWYFKCFNNDCRANDPEGGHSEIGFLILLKGWNEKEAIEEFLRLATEVDPTLADTKHYPKPVAEEPKEVVEPTTPWHDLWLKLPLTVDHRDELKKKRGFTEATIKALGFRSSIKSNRDMVDALGEKWNTDELVELGILKDDKHEIRLNPQLCGFGLTGKKDENGDPKFDWTSPIVIPYLDEAGIPFYLRPHKGGLKRKQKDQWYKEQTGGSVYCPFLLESLVAEHNGTCIVTEGEFKAAALWQCRIPAVAIPGIQFARSKAGDVASPEYKFRAELVKLLRKFNVTDVVVVFDNEVKDDPALKAYKPDPWDRHDTVVWAEYLAIDLRGEFDSVRIGHIPDAWRIEGKADFDSALAGFVNGAMSGNEKHPAFETAYGEKDGTRRARKGFLSIIEDAYEKRGYHDLFASAARRIIECKLERLFYKPLVPKGGDMEEKMARRFSESNPLNFDKPFDGDLADAFKSVRGCYYERKSVDAKSARVWRKAVETIDAQIEAEEKNPEKNVEHLKAMRTEKAAYWERIKGIPNPVSETIRLVRIRNKQGQKNDRLLRLDATSMCRASNFREWAYDTGLGVPKFGEKELQNLVEDMDHHSAFRDIYEVNTYGWHPASKLWFFGDCAIAPDGAILETDAQGIIWYEGIGYQVEAPTDESDISTGFEQGAPKLLSPHGVVEPLQISDAELLEHMGNDFLEMVGGYDSWAAIGLFFASAAAPEMLEKYGGHPGVFLHGNLSEGKTTSMRLLMRIQGFKHLDGISIEPTTEVAMARALSHYSCLFLWFDEFRQNNLKDRPGKLTIIRDAFNRGSAAKGYMSDPRKTRMVRPNTTACVTGESSSSDGATKSRFCTLNISKMRRGPRSKESLARVQKESPHYYQLFRFIMVNRKAFVDTTMHYLDVAMDAHKDEVTNERIRFVHMAAYAAFAAVTTLLDSPLIDKMKPFEDAITLHAQKAMDDVTDETFLQMFWKHVISGVHNGEIKRHLFKQRVVIRNEKGEFRACTDQELRNEVITKTAICCLNFQPIFDSYAIYVRKQGLQPPIGVNDLKKSMFSEKWASSKMERFPGEGAIRSVVISMEEADGFPFIEELESIFSHRDEQESN